MRPWRRPPERPIQFCLDLALAKEAHAVLARRSSPAAFMASASMVFLASSLPAFTTPRSCRRLTSANDLACIVAGLALARADAADAHHLAGGARIVPSSPFHQFRSFTSVSRSSKLCSTTRTRCANPGDRALSVLVSCAAGCSRSGGRACPVQVPIERRALDSLGAGSGPGSRSYGESTRSWRHFQAPASPAPRQAFDTMPRKAAPQRRDVQASGARPPRAGHPRASEHRSAGPHPMAHLLDGPERLRHHVLDARYLEDEAHRACR